MVVDFDDVSDNDWRKSLGVTLRVKSRRQRGIIRYGRLHLTVSHDVHVSTRGCLFIA